MRYRLPWLRCGKRSYGQVRGLRRTNHAVSGWTKVLLIDRERQLFDGVWDRGFADQPVTE